MELLIVFLLIVLNGVFSMSEIALISSRKNRLESAHKKGNNGAKVALELANEPNKFLSTVQIGITLIGILTGIFSGDKITSDVQLFLEGFAVLKPYASSLAVGLVVVLLTFSTLVLGELVPKRIGLNYPEKIATLVAVPMKWISIITAPFIWLLTISTEFLLKVLMIKPNQDGKITEEEIKAIIKEGTEGGEVQEIEHDIVERVFYIGDRKVNSLMTHRKSVVMLPFNADSAKTRELISEELHSVYPVYKDNADEVIGVVNLKSIFANIDKPNFDLAQLTNEAPFVMEQTTAYNALEQFKKTGVHYAFVADEYGIFQGIITLNDILEALVGDASDFYKDEFQIHSSEDGTWVIDGHFSLHDFFTQFELDEYIGEYDVTTLSGLIMTELSRIPKTGDVVIFHGYQLEVQKMEGVKIDKVVVRKAQEQ